MSNVNWLLYLKTKGNIRSGPTTNWNVVWGYNSMYIYVPALILPRPGAAEIGLCAHFERNGLKSNGLVLIQILMNLTCFFSFDFIFL